MRTHAAGVLVGFFMFLFMLLAIAATAWAGPLVAAFAVPPSVALGMAYADLRASAASPVSAPALGTEGEETT